MFYGSGISLTGRLDGDSHSYKAQYAPKGIRRQTLQQFDKPTNFMDRAA